MDTDVFFRKVALSICGDLNIEKSLHSTLLILNEIMPVSWMAIEHYDPENKGMRTIALANLHEGKSVDLLTPLTEDARQRASEKLDPHMQRIFLFPEPYKDELAKEMLNFHGVKASSLLVLTLEIGDKRIGTLVLASEGDEKLTGVHADLLSSLSAPFAIALSNTLKHRSELKLFEREFFREITLRICGNLEIEKGLQSCIEYLSDFIPADVIYLEKYVNDFGSIRCLARATVEKCEEIDVLIPLPDNAKSEIVKVINNVKSGKLPAVFINNKPQEVPFTKFTLQTLGEPSSSILSLMLIIDGEIAGALTLLAKGDDRFNERHAKLYEMLRMPFFVATMNTLKHREILRLKDLLADDNRFLHHELRRISGDEIVGANFGLKDVMFKVNQVASLDSPVLLLGETGVGKDVIANAIHYSSSRSKGPFVGVNCGAIPDTLIDSELFGHEKGAFTGALSQKRGRFERADKGTIFLDEIGELPLPAQVRLLKVLQSKDIERVGGVKTISLNIRIIAATNRNLEQMVKDGEFREDLWFRLNVFPIWIPPLRNRALDIPALIQHFIQLKSKELKLSTIPTISTGVTDLLMAYHWPGNVRELQNVVERELILNPLGPLTFEQLNLSEVSISKKLPESLPENDNLDEMTKLHIEKVLHKTEGKIHGPDGAAKLLGLNANTLRNRMDKLGIEYRKPRLKITK